MKHFIPKFLAVMLVAAACFVVVILQHKKFGKYNEEINEVTNIDSKLDKLNKELDDLKASYEDKSYGKAGISFVIDQMDNTVMSYIYPSFKEYEYKAVLAIDLDHFPGDDDVITMDDFKSLIDDDWAYCICWDGSDDFNKYMTDITKKFTEKKIEPSHTLYIRQGNFTDEVEKQAKEFGIKNIIHHGEDGKTVVSRFDSNSDMWEIGSVGYSNGSLKSYVDSAVEEGGNLILSVGSMSSDELFNVNSMNNILSGLKTYEDDDKITIDTVGGVRRYKEKLAKDQAERDKEYQKETEKVKKEIEELEAKRKDQAESDE